MKIPLNHHFSWLNPIKSPSISYYITRGQLKHSLLVKSLCRWEASLRKLWQRGLDGHGEVLWVDWMCGLTWFDMVLTWFNMVQWWFKSGLILL